MLTTVKMRKRERGKDVKEEIYRCGSRHTLKNTPNLSKRFNPKTPNASYKPCDEISNMFNIAPRFKNYVFISHLYPTMKLLPDVRNSW